MSFLSIPGRVAFAFEPGARHAAVHIDGDASMADALSKAAFDGLMAKAGIVLTEAEAEGIRAATAHVARFAEMVRVPRPVAAEPATTFAPVVAP